MIVLTVNNREVFLEELIQRLKIAGKDVILKPLVEETILTDYARENKLTATAEELQTTFDAFRKSNGLFSAAETENWLREKKLTLEDVEKEMEIKIIAAKVKEAFPREAVEKYFAENKVNMDAVEISTLTVAEEEVARELLAQILEDGADFMTLAREYSLEESAKQGGYFGVVRRTGLPGEVSAVVFGAADGEVVGPVKTEAGFSLIRVIAKRPSVLDDQREAEIRNILFQNFLKEQEGKVKISWAI